MKKFGEKEAWAYCKNVLWTLLIFLSTPYYLTNGKSYGVQIWPVGLHSEGPSEQMPINILEKGERGSIQGLPNFIQYPLLSQERVSYELQILYAHLSAQLEQKPI